MPVVVLDGPEPPEAAPMSAEASLRPRRRRVRAETLPVRAADLAAAPDACAGSTSSRRPAKLEANIQDIVVENFALSKRVQDLETFAQESRTKEEDMRRLESEVLRLRDAASIAPSRRTSGARRRESSSDEDARAVLPALRHGSCSSTSGDEGRAALWRTRGCDEGYRDLQEILAENQELSDRVEELERFRRMVEAGEDPFQRTRTEMTNVRSVRSFRSVDSSIASEPECLLKRPRTRFRVTKEPTMCVQATERVVGRLTTRGGARGTMAPRIFALESEVDGLKERLEASEAQRASHDQELTILRAALIRGHEERDAVQRAFEVLTAELAEVKAAKERGTEVERHLRDELAVAQQEVAVANSELACVPRSARHCLDASEDALDVNIRGTYDFDKQAPRASVSTAASGGGLAQLGHLRRSQKTSLGDELALLQELPEEDNGAAEDTDGWAARFECERQKVDELTEVNTSLCQRLTKVMHELQEAQASLMERRETETRMELQLEKFARDLKEAEKREKELKQASGSFFDWMVCRRNINEDS